MCDSGGKTDLPDNGKMRVVNEELTKYLWRMIMFAYLEEWICETKYEWLVSEGVSER